MSAFTISYGDGVQDALIAALEAIKTYVVRITYDDHSSADYIIEEVGQETGKYHLLARIYNGGKVNRTTPPLLIDLAGVTDIHVY